MGLQVVPGYIGQSGYNHPVELFRNLLKAQTAAGKGYMRSSSDFSFTPSGASLSLAVAEGWAAIHGTENSSQGSYFVWSNGADNIAWPSASGQPRIDSLILRVIDKQYGTDPDANGAQYEVVQGVPSGSPSAIADVEFEPGGDFHRPGAWWRMANVLIEPGDTVMSATTITDLRGYADFQRNNSNILKNWYDNTLQSAWTPYTPTLTADGGSPTIGTGGVIAGRYKALGKTVHYRGRLLFGTGASAGTGAFYVSIPLTAASVAVSGMTLPNEGSARIRDASPAANYAAICDIQPDLHASRMGFVQNAAVVTGSHPMSWAPSDHISWDITYEAA